MAYCTTCGADAPAGSKFCPSCGADMHEAVAASPMVAGVAPKTNGMAIASLVLGILGLCGIGAILAVILGFVSRGRIARSNGQEAGSGLALAGIILGFVQMGVAVLVIPAILIPTFLGARVRAEDRTAQSTLRNAVTEAKAIFTDHSNMRDVSVQSLSQGERSLTFVSASTDSTSPTTVSVAVSGTDTFIAATRSDSGRCWFVRDIETPSQGAVTWNEVRSATSCRADSLPASPWTLEPSSVV